LIEAARGLASTVGVVRACESLQVARATFYRHCSLPHTRGEKEKSRILRATPNRALSEEERGKVLDVLHSERMVDKAPLEVYATLLDEGIYLCSIRTMYRILDDCQEVRERRDQLKHPQYKKPELIATGPNQVWSWDITKLLGPVKWTYYYLYVILDIFSRYVVGWMVADRESGELARWLIEESCRKQGIKEEHLTLHSDRGIPMKSKPVSRLLAQLGVTKSFSRPSVSNDNPFSESQFKTLKYRPEFPERFGSQEGATSFCEEYFRWYNQEHRHSGIGLMTPEDVHYGRAEEVTSARQKVLEAAYEKHPERFVNKRPEAPKLPEEVWINEPKKDRSDNEVAH
jgi:putative transposase